MLRGDLPAFTLLETRAFGIERSVVAQRCHLDGTALPLQLFRNGLAQRSQPTGAVDR